MRYILSASLLLIFSLSSCVDNKNEDPNLNNASLCGNNTIDPGEECDDGNTLSHDGCDSSCKVESICGNDTVDPGEECDDGNLDSGDGCSSICQIENGCGNGVLEVGEQCDDDNLTDGDGCSSQCIVEGVITCGNGILEYTEGCDDGNTDDGDGCSSSCMKENGCGDGNLDEVTEECDDGNAIAGDGCDYNCKVEFVCGNNQCSSEEGETCDNCPGDCCSDCGNGILDVDEECDDGNNVSGDGCSRGCKDEDGVAVCGNGLWEEGEECEDGNLIDHDGCSSECVKEYECGDGECFADEGESCQNCPYDCCPSCGNNTRQADEECDGADLNGITCEDLGYDGGTLACGTYCEFDYSGCTGDPPSCGNGVKEVGEECDGTDMGTSICENSGFTSGLLLCNPDCSLNYTGCRDQYRYYYENFDSLLPPDGWSFLYPWEWGKVAVSGPSAAFSGDYCVATTIQGMSPSSSEYGDNHATTPSIDLTAAVEPVLYFWAWVDLSTDNYYYDEWHVEYSTDGGSTWNTLTDADPEYSLSTGWEMFSGADSWNPYIINLSSLAGESSVKIRFAANLDHSTYTSEAGIYVDDVMVIESGFVPVAITNPTNLGNAVVERAFSRQITTWGGSGDFSYQVVDTIPPWLSLDSSTGILSGTPSASDVGAYTFTVKVQDNINPLNSTQKTFEVGVFAAVYFEDFEGGSLPSGWTLGGTTWEYGQASSSGPSQCASGSYCLGTDFSADYPTYMEFGTDCVTSANIDLTSASNPVLTFSSWLYSEDGYDGGHLEVKQGTTWTMITDVTPVYNDLCDQEDCWSNEYDTPAWSTIEADISSYAGETVQIRWCFRSDVSGNYDGWFLDDVTIMDN
ncbi:MAG: DUF4215 domain-containing protein [Deltaproteobacteria bacterium]|nr:DUF4215 domain-containing protein [Deltaproteobacteria bacterium]